MESFAKINANDTNITTAHEYFKGAVAKFGFFFIYQPIFLKFAHIMWIWIKNQLLP